MSFWKLLKVFKKGAFVQFVVRYQRFFAVIRCDPVKWHHRQEHTGGCARVLCEDISCAVLFLAPSC